MSVLFTFFSIKCVLFYCGPYVQNYYKFEFWSLCTMFYKVATLPNNNKITAKILRYLLKALHEVCRRLPETAADCRQLPPTAADKRRPGGVWSAFGRRLVSGSRRLVGVVGVWSAADLTHRLFEYIRSTVPGICCKSFHSYNNQHFRHGYLS